MRALARATASAALALAGLGALVGCDTSQAFHRPDPSWSRMMEQPRVDAFDPSTFFADGRAMRPPPPGTVPTSRLGRSRAASLGLEADGKRPLARVPVPIDRALLERGRAAFDVTCATCHGITGDGRSVVAEKMTLRRPPSLHEARIRAFAPGRLYQIVRNGYGLMPSYASMLDEHDRWAVVAYVRALQVSRGVELARLPPSMQAELRAEAP